LNTSVVIVIFNRLADHSTVEFVLSDHPSPTIGHEVNFKFNIESAFI